MNKHALCEAFCQDLAVTDVPAGLAVRTAFMGRDGDAIGFYLTRHPANPAQWRVEDAGLAMPMLEASGVNLTSGTRAQALQVLLSEHGAQFDDDAMELHTDYLPEAELPAAAMRFVALLLRLQDLDLLAPDSVANTFRDDVQADLDRYFGGKARMRMHVAPHPQLNDFETDVLIQHEESTLALYFGTSDERVNEAVILALENKQRGLGLKVAVVLEQPKPPQINSRTMARALNRLDATTAYGNDQFAAMERVADLVGVDLRTAH